MVMNNEAKQIVLKSELSLLATFGTLCHCFKNNLFFFHQKNFYDAKCFQYKNCMAFQNITNHSFLKLQTRTASTFKLGLLDHQRV